MFRRIFTPLFFSGLILAQAPCLPPGSPITGYTLQVDEATGCWTWKAPPAAPAAFETPIAAGYPQEFFTAGVQYTSKASPHYTGWVAGAVYLGSGTYSFSGMYLTPQGKRLSTSMTTGVAQHLRDVGRLHLYALGGAGMGATGTATGSSLALALNGGVMAVIPIAGGFSANVMGQAFRVGSGVSVVVGVGLGWGR